MAAIAATWTLDIPGAQPKAESVTQPNPAHGEESIIGIDLRERVSPYDFQDGGKYRSIVKIQSQFRTPEGEEVWMMGSGWLVSPDTLVTAGHVVYDQAYKYGACTQIKCYIGYEGVDSVKPSDDPIPAVQPRYGKQIITTKSWITVDGDRLHDVAFIRVHKPFVGKLNVFKAVDTEPSATLLLGVVGYPGDKELKDEKGALMYALFATTTYDVETYKRHMISYPISTFGGQSGAPVLARTKDGLFAIGTHCYGAGQGEKNNSGNPIGGKWGNNYTKYLSLYERSDAFVGELNKINFVSTEAGEATPGPAPPGPPPVVRTPEHGVEEGFLDVIKSIAKIGSTALSLGAPLLGPVGAVVGPVAGGLLGAIAGQESTIDAMVKRTGDPIAPATAERAVLAESSLQAVLSIYNEDPHHPVLKPIFAHMSNEYMTHAPDVDTIATQLAPQLTESALDLAGFKLGRALIAPPSATESEPELPRKALNGLPSPHSSEAFTGQEEAFVEGLLGATVPIAGAEEGAFDFLGPLITKAVKVAKPLVSRAAKYAVKDILPHLVGQIAGSGNATNSESAFAPTTPATQEASRLLFKRALLADAALSALTTLPKDQLKTLKVKHTVLGQTHPQEEGIFDFVKSTAQRLGPYALKATKAAIKRLGPGLVDATAAMLKERLVGKPEAVTSFSSLTSSGSEADFQRLRRQPSNLSVNRARLIAEDSWSPASDASDLMMANPDQPPIIRTPPPFEP
ncbi:hypothetical protein HGRIS_009197 [Hohenbuehelia grisea]|uniref:Serine protease n=1 Tax=Hohenbuehelia grisea TaxID=104357 RepID=A0ABR3J0V8_9AGAR